MKRIIMFVLLFAALKVAGQTTGYLRFDTVRIMKQNGTCELYIINKTKDSLGLLTNVGGGLTQFKRARAINDSTVIIGNDTISLKGAGGNQNLQQVLNNGSTLTENESITIADSLKFILGDVVIDSLRLPSLPSSTDTTTHKPIAVDASGNVVKMAGWPNNLEWVSVTDYGAKANDTLTDYTTNMQAALNSGARTILFPTGLYILTNSLKINSNQTIIGYGAKLIRKANTDAMIINESDGSVGGHEADSNMAVMGITFEGNGVNYPTSGFAGATLLVFGHSKNITIKDCELTNTAVFHCVEINSCKNVSISNVYTHDANIPGRELIQIDLAINATAFPWFGPYDNTACDGVVVRDCVFKNVTGFGIGSHNATAAFPQRNITIQGCYFENISTTAIEIYNYANLKILNNIIRDCRRGIQQFGAFNNPDYQRGVVIQGNSISNITKHASDGNGIFLQYYRNLTVKDNTFDTTRNVGIALYNCDTFCIDNNVINKYGHGLGNVSSGIELSATTNGQIINNKIKSDTVAFRRDAISLLSNSNSVTVDKNIIRLPSLAKASSSVSALGQQNAISGTGIYIGHNMVNDTAIGNTVSVSSTFTTTGTERVILASTTGGAYAITVQPRMLNEGITIIKTSGSNTLTVSPSTGTINGLSSITVDSTVTIRSDGINYYTMGGGSGGGGVTDHGALTGLGDDDHTQYALLAGRSGGQTLIGGTGTTDDLVLQSTSGVGASGADIIFKGGNNGATEFARFLNSGNFGIGLNNPSAPFELTTSGQTGIKVNMSNTSEGTYGIKLNRSTVSGENAILFSTNNADKFFFGQNNSGGAGGDDIILFSLASNKMVFNASSVSGDITFGNSLNTIIKNNGDIGAGTTSPTAKLHIAAGTATANTAPLKLTSGTNLTTPENGAIEFDGTHFYGTAGGTRYQLDQVGSGITSVNSQTGPALTISNQGSIVITNPSSDNIGLAVDVTSDRLPRTIDAVITTAQNTGTAETDLFSKNIAGLILNTDKQTLNFEVDGEFNDNTATAQLKLYFGGNVTLNTGAVNISTANTAWRLKGYIIRTSSSTAHVTYELHCPGLATPVFVGYSNLTSIDFTTTNVLKVTAQAGGAGGGTGDITAHSWQILYKPQPL